MPSSDALRDCSNMSQDSLDTSQQRKRQASQSPLNEGANKRSRPNADSGDNTVVNDSPDRHDRRDIQDNSGPPQSASNDSSVERLLSVPLDVVFREVPSAAAAPMSQRRKPLLTRAEAQCLVKTAQLAHQVDVIVDISSHALSRQQWCRSFRESIQGVPLLRSVLPVLSVHGDKIPSSALKNVQGELDRVLLELEACASALHQYSEQNYTLSESLLDAFGDGQAPSSGQELAREKRIMAEIEEEVCVRIDRLLGMAALNTQDDADSMGNVEDAFEKATGIESRQFESMRKFCYRMLGIDAIEDASGVAAVEEEGDNNGIPSDIENGEDENPEPKQQGANEGPNRDLLLALADEVRGQWSGSTVAIHTPEHHSSMNGDQDESQPDEVGSFMEPEMTQGISNAVEALAVLASGSRCDNSRRMSPGDE